MEEHLFGPDLSPPLTRCSIRETPEASIQRYLSKMINSSNLLNFFLQCYDLCLLCTLHSEPVCDIKEVEPIPDNAAELKTQTSVTSSETTTSESRCKSISCFSLS